MGTTSGPRTQDRPSPRPAGGPVRYALVGAGHRAQLYVDALFGSHRDCGELVALVDPNDVRVEYYRQLHAWPGDGPAGDGRPGDGPAGDGRPGDGPAGDGRPGDGKQAAGYGPGEFAQMVHRERPDAVIVTTVDRWHAEYVARSLELGCSVICEKPLTVDVEGCRRIGSVVERTGARLAVTLNYRYSPRNSVVRALLADGAIGEVTSVHFEWVLDTVHGADYFRRWHRDKTTSGGLLVHKSSHHFDLVNWWLGDVPATVFAQGGLRFYGERNAAARGLGPRPVRGHAAAGLGTDPFLLDLAADPRLRRLYLDAESRDGYLRDRDVFAPGITIEDNLAVLVRYRRGAVLTYSLNAHSPWEGYRVAINGTAGRLELNVCERPSVPGPGGGAAVVDPTAVGQPGASAVPEASAALEASVAPGAPARVPGDELLLQRHWEGAQRVDIAAVAARDVDRPPRGGAHGGGDLLLLDDLLRGVAVVGPDPLRRAAGYRDGLYSVLVGIAANRSLATGHPVDLADLDVPLPPPPGEDLEVPLPPPPCEDRDGPAGRQAGAASRNP